MFLDYLGLEIKEIDLINQKIEVYQSYLNNLTKQILLVRQL